MKEKVYKLAIESGIGGGSVSVFENGKILDYRSGKNPAGKADYLIEKITGLLKMNGLERSQIAGIIYSEYPGSHTGLKIGASIARGLGLAVNAGIKSGNLFDCIFRNYLKENNARVLIALPAGVSDFFWRIYDADGLIADSGHSNSEKDRKAFKQFEKPDGVKILMPVKLFADPEQIREKFFLEGKVETIDLGVNLSGYLAFE